MQTDNRNTQCRPATRRLRLPTYRLPEQPRAPTTGVTNRTELRAFVGDHSSEIARKVQILCYGSTEAAAEVLQELYPRLVTVLQRSTGGLRNPWAVIHTVAGRLAIDRLRKNARERRRRDPVDTALLPARCAELSTATQADSVRAALTTLPPRLRAIVSGIYFDGRKGKDVARELDLSEARLSELKSEALLRLRGLLGAVDGEAA